MKKILVLLLLIGANAHATSFAFDPTDPRTDLINDLFKGKVTTKEDLQDRLRDLMNNPLNKLPVLPNTPVDPSRPDEAKGCVSHTHCTGEGKDKTCDTWEVCVSS